MEPMPAPDGAPSEHLDEDAPARTPLTLVRERPELDGRLPGEQDGEHLGDRIIRRPNGYVRLQALADPKAPWWLRTLFLAMWAMLGTIAAHQMLGFGGAALDQLVNVWFNNTILLGAGVATAWRAIAIHAERRAWAVISASLFVYYGGDQVYSTFYADTEPAVSWADAFYLAFPALLFVGIALLVRTRIPRFELDRWIDGIAAALLVSAPGVILILAPTMQKCGCEGMAKFVSGAYPISDIVMLGAVVGVIALAGWHPGRAWLMFALGLTCFVVADAFYAVGNLEQSYDLGAWYEWMWPAAALLIAASAWMRPLRHAEVQAWGYRAIALPILCQVAPIVLMFLKDEPRSEQIIMSAVLMIVLVQLVVTRPRKPEHIA
jgi:hypothetical protein